MPLSMLMFMSYSFPSESGGVGYQYAPVLAMFVIIWVNDTAAYFLDHYWERESLLSIFHQKNR